MPQCCWNNTLMHLPSTSSYCYWVESHKKRYQEMGVGVGCRRLLLGALVSVGVIWFMFLAISVNRQTKRAVLVVPMKVVISKHLKLLGMQRHALHSDSKLIFVSKRRVPNGPDPIHNRYTLMRSNTFWYFCSQRNASNTLSDILFPTHSK